MIKICFAEWTVKDIQNISVTWSQDRCFSDIGGLVKSQTNVNFYGEIAKKTFQ